MTEFEYLAVVEEQIRQKEIAEELVQELRTHIEDQAKAYVGEGMEQEEAMKKAVEEMGDPVEAGVQLDCVHQPHMDFRLFLVLIGVNIAAYLFLWLGAGEQGVELAMHQMSFRMLSFLWMILFALQKYKAESISSYAGWILFLAGGMGVVLFDQLIPWVRDNEQAVSILIRPVLNCSVAFYAKIVYDNRNGGQKRLYQVLAAAGVTCALSLICHSYFYTVLVVCAHSFLLSMAVRRGWYHINGRKMAKIWALPGILTGAGAVLIGKGILEGRFKGGIGEYATILDLPGVLIGNYGGTGIAVVILWSFLMILVAAWMIHDTIKLTNHLCRMYCTGILLAYGIAVIFSLLCIMGFGDGDAVFFPFFSIDRSQMGINHVFYTMMAGLFLQYHRHDRVIPAKRTKQAES